MGTGGAAALLVRWLPPFFWSFWGHFLFVYFAVTKAKVFLSLLRLHLPFLYVFDSKMGNETPK